MSASRDFIALEWIKSELAQTLDAAQRALEESSRSTDDPTSMEACLGAMRQVHGTLKMIEIEGPVRIACELERLAEALVNVTVDDVPRAQALLMEGILQLPTYLDRIRREQKDNPEFVASVVANLQSVQMAKPESAEDQSLEAGELILDIPLINRPPQLDDINIYVQAGGPDQAKKLWQKYHGCLLALGKHKGQKQSARTNLVTMAKVCARTTKDCGNSPLGRYAVLVQALIEGLLTGGIKLTASTMAQLKALDSQFKTLAQGTEDSLNEQLPASLLMNCYELLTSAKKESPRISAALKLFSTPKPVPEPDVSGLPWGPIDITDTEVAVAHILIEEMTVITDKLDLYVRSDQSNVGDLLALVPLMEQTSSTFSVVGMNDHKASLAEQMTAINQIESADEHPDEEQLLSIATALLQIQSSLWDLVGKSDDSATHGTLGGLDDAQALVLSETRNGLLQCKETITDYISQDFDADIIASLPSLLMSLRGGLKMVDQDRSAKVIHACSIYINKQLLRSSSLAPSESQMEDLADAITSVDYYLERLLENPHEPYLQLLKVSESAVERLGLDVNNLISEEYRNTLSQSVVVPSSEVLVDEPDEGGGIDQDVHQLFAEEAEAMLADIQASLQVWPEDQEAALAKLRHAFHALKGSGSMVDAVQIVDLSGAVDRLLNDLLEGPLTDVEESHYGFVCEVSDILPALIASVESGELIDTASLVSKAERLLDQLASDANAVAQSAESELDAVSSPDIESAAVATDDNSSEEDNDGTKEAVDEEILDIFVEEAEELGGLISQAIGSWHSTPASMGAKRAEYLEHLLRHLHTLKGGARLAGLAKLGEVVHEFETSLVSIQQTADVTDEALFALLNKGQDDIAERVAALKNSEPTDYLAETSPASSHELRSDDTLALQDGKNDKNLAAQDNDPVVILSPAQNEELVRVPAELLEGAISLVSESNFARNRVERQVGDLVGSLSDMDDTINKIRDQAKRLELEAAPKEGLEEDRYSALREVALSLNEASSDLQDLKAALSNKGRDAEDLLQQQARLGSELQAELTRTRMVPFSRLIPRLKRIVSQIGAELEKSIHFEAFDIEGELDRRVMERIIAPLEHMFRNAVDHGIESAETRQKLDKPELGLISLTLSRQERYVLMTISDDGAGIDIALVREKAIERGLMAANGELSDEDVQKFILEPGISTAEKLTQISGRGVGLDVVNAELKQLGGTVSIQSTLGVGTEFTIQIPISVSIDRALMVQVQGQTYGVPLIMVEGVVRLSPTELESYYQPNAPEFEYDGQPYELKYLGELLEGSDKPTLADETSLLPVILGRSGEKRVALQVDKVMGNQEVVLKSLGPQFDEVVGIAGAMVSGDGSVVMVLDVMGLFSNTDYHLDHQQTDSGALQNGDSESGSRRRVMVVDDSLTVRKLTARLLERQGWLPVIAKDGLDAFDQLQNMLPNGLPDVMLLDIEMPRMDGFELLRALRSDEAFSQLDVIMISSRSSDEYRQQAHDLGVEHFLSKPFQEANLISIIEGLLNEGGADLDIAPSGLS